MGTVKIRPAVEADYSQLLDIYTPYILGSGITFDTEVPSPEEWTKKIDDVRKKFPYLVAEADGQLVGFAYASPFKSRCAYEWSVESSVYVRQDGHRKGIGASLYEALLSMLKEQGVVNVIGGIALPNEPSVKLHEKCGIRPVAKFFDVGFKLGRWWDVGYWQLQLQKPSAPQPLKDTKNWEGS